MDVATLILEAVFKDITPFHPEPEQQVYPRLEERLDELGRLYQEAGKNNVEYLMEEDGLIHVLTPGRLPVYESIREKAMTLGVTRVVDIGCAYGHQSEVFLEVEMDYVGVTNHDSQFWNRDRFDYVIDHYPCPLPVKENDLAISVLCLTWNCFLHEKEKTLMEQCEALLKDFSHCILYTDKPEYVANYFKTCENLGNRLYYFSNQ